MQAKYKIGLKFIRYSNKRKDIETINDILTTRNSKNEIVKIIYLTNHVFCGQTINAEIPASTIARSTILG